MTTTYEVKNLVKLNMDGNAITNAALGVASTDVATVQNIDNAIALVTQHAKTVFTGNVASLSITGTVNDGYTILSGDEVLLQNQASGYHLMTEEFL
jgi:hypothetical protein